MTFVVVIDVCAAGQVFLAPQLDLSDLPLKTFYRYVLPEIDEQGIVLHANVQSCGAHLSPGQLPTRRSIVRLISICSFITTKSMSDVLARDPGADLAVESL